VLKRIKAIKINLLLGTILIILAGTFFSKLVIHEGLYGSKYWIDFLVYLVAWGASLYVFDFFIVRDLCDRKNLFKKILAGFVTSFITISVFKIFFMKYVLARTLLKNLVMLLMFILMMLLIELFVLIYTRKNVLIIGDNRAQRAAERLIFKCKYLNIKVKGYISLDNDSKHFNVYAGDSIDEKKDVILRKYRCLGKLENLAEVLQNKNIDVLIVNRNEKEIINHLHEKGFTDEDILFVDEIFENVQKKIPILHVDEDNLEKILEKDKLGEVKNFFYKIFKRSIAITLSILGLLITSPIILLSGIIIKLESKGPVFFKQKRIGKDGKIFILYKLRSMREHDPEEFDKNPKSDQDPRITTFGKIMRKFRIDEFPQFINILKGDMNLIGPRPETSELVEKYKGRVPYYDVRHEVRPGITGWAQVNYSYGANTHDTKHKLQYDLYYIKNQSFFLDFKIALRTAKIMIGADGR